MGKGKGPRWQVVNALSFVDWAFTRTASPALLPILRTSSYHRAMETLADRMELIDKHITRAAAAADGDSGASPVLRAVLREFARKATKCGPLIVAGGGTGREALVELEQAGDSAWAGAQADAGITPATRQAAEVAHASVCMLKAGA
jgi:hypothetical protein